AAVRGIERREAAAQRDDQPASVAALGERRDLLVERPARALGAIGAAPVQLPAEDVDPIESLLAHRPQRALAERRRGRPDAARLFRARAHVVSSKPSCGLSPALRTTGHAARGALDADLAVLPQGGAYAQPPSTMKSCPVHIALSS